MRSHRPAQTRGRKPGHAWQLDVSASASDPMQILAGSMLCRLHFWSEEEWAALPATGRPEHYCHAPVLGCWIGAIPIAGLN
jgi:hypothetical protein